MKSYGLPYGWKISFPESWVYEHESYPEGDQHLFYPRDSDITFRVTSLRIKNESGGLFPIEGIQRAFSSSCRELTLSNNIVVPNKAFLTECYRGATIENGQQIHRVSIGAMTPGHLLTANIFASCYNDIERFLYCVDTIDRS